MKPHYRAVKNTGDFENPLRRTKPPLANMACETSPTSALTKCTENCAIGVAYVCANHCRSASDIRTTDRQRFPQISSRIQPFFHSPFLSAIRLTERGNDNNKQRPAACERQTDAIPAAAALAAILPRFSRHAISKFSFALIARPRPVPVHCVPTRSGSPAP